MTLEGKGQLTLVALYGEKRDTYPDLWQLIKELQSGVATILGEDLFVPYSEERVHGTIIGLEGDRAGDVILNRNAYQKLGQLRPIDLESAIDFLLDNNELLPIDILIGGYKEGNKYPFTSQDRHPFLRSFSIQGSIAVAMGWPKKGKLFTSGINKLRRAFNRFNIYHKYHGSDEAYDNDFFFVLGNVSKGLNSNIIATCETQMREMLSKTNVPPITINKDQLRIVQYREGDTTFENVSLLTLEEAKESIAELNRFYTEIGC